MKKQNVLIYMTHPPVERRMKFFALVARFLGLRNIQKHFHCTVALKVGEDALVTYDFTEDGLISYEGTERPISSMYVVLLSNEEVATVLERLQFVTESGACTKLYEGLMYALFDRVPKSLMCSSVCNYVLYGSTRFVLPETLLGMLEQFNGGTYE